MRISGLRLLQLAIGLLLFINPCRRSRRERGRSTRPPARSSGDLQEPGNREFAKFVADSLQKAWESYNTDFKRDDGRAPMGWLNPGKRMTCRSCASAEASTAEYKFLSWNGYINVDPSSARTTSRASRSPLPRALPRAPGCLLEHDDLRRARHWWFEATAEWAGSSTAAPIPPSGPGRDEALQILALGAGAGIREHEEKLMAYAFCMMVEHAETKSPGYVRRALNGSDITSRAFYEGL